jgi:hypothetical protein
VRNRKPAATDFIPDTAVFAKQQQKHEENTVFTFGGRSASFRGADAAEVCSYVGFFAIDDGL